MMVQVEAANGHYEIDIGTNKLQKEMVRSYANYAVITDSTVDKLYGQMFAENRKIVLQPGEKSKSFANLEWILNKLASMQLSRGDVVVALGGGVVGDIAGFAAAVYKRGVHLIQVPTTLLAQVDSSVGGKVAVNLANGKNMAGTFYQPERVIIDTNTLKTLDARQYAAGMAEVIKYAYIADIGLYDGLQKKTMPVDKIISRCCRTKAKIVQEDPFDLGIRMILNYGHTIGHAVEAAAGFGNILHGEAVAIGMVYAARIGEVLGISPKGLTEDTEKFVSLYSLPYTINEKVVVKALEYIKDDKKIQDGCIQMVLLAEVGEAKICTMEVDEIITIIRKEMRI